MMLQNDHTIAKAPPIFGDYLRTAFKSSRGSVGQDVTDYDSPGRTMSLQRMELLVTPIAQNVLSIQNILEHSSLANSTGEKVDDKALQAARQAMEQAVGAQSTSLDLINGFVTTQQLGDIQHSGQEYINDLNRTDIAPNTVSQMATPTPGPFQNPDPIGLQNPNPYEIDPTDVPGLQLGYNPVSLVAHGLGWVQDETAKREQAVAASIGHIATICGILPGGSASPAPGN